MTHTPSTPANPAQVTDAMDRLEAIIHELAGEVAPNGPEDRAWAIINDLRAGLEAALAENVGVSDLLDRFSKALGGVSWYDDDCRLTDAQMTNRLLGRVKSARAAEAAAEIAANSAHGISEEMVEAALNSWFNGEIPISFSGDFRADMRAALTAAIGAGGQPVAVKDWDIETTADKIARQLAAEVKSFGPTGRIHGETYNAAKAGAIAAFKCAVATLSAIAHPVQPGWRDIPVTDETVTYITQYGGRCRDCADAMGVCPTSGLPCDPHEARAAIRHVLRAVNYGFGEGFLSFPAAPQPKGE